MKKLSRNEQQETFKKLSDTLQKDIKGWLKVYDSVYYETYLDGSVHVSSHAGIKNHYEKELVSMVVFERSAILTDQEIIQANKELSQCNWF